jgi:hypothetical protein
LKKGVEKKEKGFLKLGPVSQQQGMMRGHTGYLSFAIKF